MNHKLRERGIMQIWIKNREKALKAIDASIRKWEKIAHGTYREIIDMRIKQDGKGECPLCEVFSKEDKDCTYCPLRVYSSELYLRENPRGFGKKTHGRVCEFTPFYETTFWDWDPYNLCVKKVVPDNQMLVMLYEVRLYFINLTNPNF